METIRMAMQALRMNLTRAILTICMISLGIMSLIGMMTALRGLEQGLIDNFVQMGTNSFNIETSRSSVHFGGRSRRTVSADNISLREAERFKELYQFSPLVSIMFSASSIAIVKHAAQETNPNIKIIGTDANYLFNSGLKLAIGRNFSDSEQQKGSSVAIIGHSLKKTLFGDKDATGKSILVGNKRFMVIGVLEEKGSSMGVTVDNFVIVPLHAARPISSGNESYNISVSAPDVNYLDMAVEEATATMRVVRKLRPGQQNDFEITRSDSLVNSLKENLSMVGLFAFIIGFITLLGAAVGLMNIMLVSVKERTREIGTRKALGATSGNIRRQFLFEAIAIGQFGGLAGVALGLALGNLVAYLISGTFAIPWGWVITGFVICFFVGILAGLYPAIKASKQNPIDALRYE